MHQKVMDNYKKLGLTRYRRIENYIELLEEKIIITNEDDIRVTRDLKILMQERFNAIRSLYFITAIAYVGVYFSFVSFFMSELILVSEIADFMGNIIGFFGTTFFLLLLFFSNRLSMLHYQDLILLSSHFIAIYEKYDTHNKDTLFGDLNRYNTYIQYFRKRGL